MKPFRAVALVPLAAALNVTYYQNVSLAPSPLPLSHAASDGEQIIGLFQDLGRTTVWKSIANITIEGDTFEPEGMVRLGDDRYIVSCGEYIEPTKKYNRTINGTDRTAGAGFGHLIVFDGQGRRIADATLTKRGAIEYHNGGLDYDGEYIWGTIAQYRPNSTGYVYKTKPGSMVPVEVVHYGDHIGGIVHDTCGDSITVLNWGCRNASSWDLGHSGFKHSYTTDNRPDSVIRTPSYFVDYQDCKWLGRSRFYGGKSVMLCSGVASLADDYVLGGIALVDVRTMVPLVEVPITLESALGVRMTMNPVDVSVTDGKLRLYWMPDQHNSTLYIYEAQPDSPLELGEGAQ